jgi:glycosyltransferase involved in cell wall biosynthesis
MITQHRREIAVLEVVADGSPGGGTTAVLGLCKDLSAKETCRVGLVTQEGSYAFREAKANGIKVFGIDFFKSRFDVTIAKKLSNIIAEYQPEIVHAHGSRAGNPIAAIRQHEWKTVYTVHGYHFPNKHPLVRPLFVNAERKIARSADRVIFVSRSDRRTAERYNIISQRTSSSIIYNGIETDITCRGALEPKSSTILFLSRLHRQKAPEVAVRMMLYLEDLDCKLVMIGGGPLVKRVAALVRKLKLDHRIELLGPVEREVALKRLQRSRLMIFPSLWEGLPIAPIEAMFYSVPVIASDIPGTDEVIVNGETGVLVQGQSPAAFAQAVRNLWFDDAAHDRMAAAGRERAANMFLKETNSERHWQLYNEVLREM